jgi:hypothetical protein
MSTSKKKSAQYEIPKMYSYAFAVVRYGASGTHQKRVVHGVKNLLKNSSSLAYDPTEYGIKCEQMFVPTCKCTSIATSTLLHNKRQSNFGLLIPMQVSY